MHFLGRMTIKLDVLQCGSCEGLKVCVHGTALGLAVVMGAYNAAAWLTRRQPHLAVNAVLISHLPYPEDSRLVRIYNQNSPTNRWPTGGWLASSGRAGPPR